MTTTGRRTQRNNFSYSPIHSARNGLAHIFTTKEKRKMFTSPSLQTDRTRPSRPSQSSSTASFPQLLVLGIIFSCDFFATSLSSRQWWRVGTFGDFRLLFPHIVAPKSSAYENTPTDPIFKPVHHFPWAPLLLVTESRILRLLLS